MPQDAAHVTCFQCEVLKLHSNFKVPFLPACLPALLADQQVRICLSGIFPTGLGWDELWCDTLPSVLLGSRGDQDKSPCCPTGDMLRSCFSCFWGPDQDAEDLDTTWYCIPWEVRTVYKGGAQQNYVRRWDNILKWDVIIQRVIIHYSALFLSHTIWSFLRARKVRWDCVINCENLRLLICNFVVFWLMGPLSFQQHTPGCNSGEHPNSNISRDDELGLEPAGNNIR